jgi:hypothetical protein
MIEFTAASSHYVLFPANAMIRNVSGACLMGWVNHYTSPAGSFDRMICTSMSSGADYSRAGLGIREDDTLYAVARSQLSDTGAVIGSTGIVPLNTYTHIAVNIDFVNVLASFYVNGLFIDTVAGDWTSGLTENLDSLGGTIGASAAGLRFHFDGCIDDARIYDRLVTQPEIQTVVHCLGSDEIFYGMKARYQMFEKPPAYVCAGTETVKNIAEGGVQGTPTAGCTYRESMLRYRRRNP